MQFSYRLQKTDGAFAAECLELDVVGEGPSEDAAVASLRDLLEERMLRPDAIAPPASGAEGKIDLVKLPSAP